MSPERPSEGAFDCIAFKRRVQSKICEETEGMSAEEEIRYFRRRVEAGPFAGLWREIAPRAARP